jgi:uncharacterized protein YhaN
MRLDCIDLIRYGHFSGRKIEFPARRPDFYVIYGDNEAGKSTLLRSISALLFGIPVTTPDVHTFKGPELRIGATVSEGSNCFSFRRRKGTSGTLLSVEEAQIPDDKLKSFSRELDRDRFEQFFGLNHQRLREGGEELLRGQGDVGSALFQAAGLLDLRRLLDKLDDDAKELFSPRSRTKKISSILDAYKQAKAEVRRLAISGSAAKEKKAELEAAEEQLFKLKQESHALQQELLKLRRIESNKPDLVRLANLRTALAELESAPALPPDAGRQRDGAVAALAEADRQINALTSAIEQRETKIQELPGNALLDAYKEEIEKLNTGAAGYLQNVSERDKRLRQRDEELHKAETAWKEIWYQAISEADKLRTVYATKEDILSLIADHKGLIVALGNAEEELSTVVQKQLQLEEELAANPEVADPSVLRAAIEQAKLLGDTEHLGSKLRSEGEQYAGAASRKMQKLPLWSRSIDDLESLKTPLLATVEQYSRQWDTLVNKREKLQLQRESLQQTMHEKENELARLSAKASSAGENELKAAREKRDGAWALIRAFAFANAGSPDGTMTQASDASSLADTFTSQMQEADQIADVRFANARDVVIHDRLKREIAVAKEEKQKLATNLDQVEGAERELRNQWNREWADFGTTPLLPSEMKEWLQMRQMILEEFSVASARRSELQLLEDRVKSAAAEVAAKWFEMDPSVDHAKEQLPVLLRMAESFAREIEQARRTRSDIQKQLRSLSLERRRTKLEECNEALSEWNQKWAPQVQALRLLEGSAPAHVAKALVVLEKVLRHLDEAGGFEYRAKRIGENIAVFENQVARLCDAMDLSCRSLPADGAIRQLHSNMVQLGNADAERKTLRGENAHDRQALAEYRGRAQEASATLERLALLAGCSDEELEAAIAASEQKLSRKWEYQRVAESLIERNGIDLPHIEQEAAGYDLDSLRVEISAKAEDYNSSVEEISQVASNHGELMNRFKQLENSEDSALQSQKAEDALATLRPALEQYLRLSLAAEVLRKAIESYREKHQGPILTRASELFSHLTVGRHSGLITDFGEDDKPVLVAIRRNGERVHVDGLSDGTLDQLYFALRLAAIEDHVRRLAPCPVVLDDLLINSDDSRISAAVEVIEQLALNTQVLFFTHHRHVADLAVRANAHLIELNSLSSAAIA